MKLQRLLLALLFVVLVGVVCAGTAGAATADTEIRVAVKNEAGKPVGNASVILDFLGADTYEDGHEKTDSLGNPYQSGRVGAFSAHSRGLDPVAGDHPQVSDLWQKIGC